MCSAIRSTEPMPFLQFPLLIDFLCAVLSAIESKLLRDVQDARDAGFSVDEIIQDLQNKGKSAITYIPMHDSQDHPKPLEQRQFVS